MKAWIQYGIFQDGNLIGLSVSDGQIPNIKHSIRSTRKVLILYNCQKILIVLILPSFNTLYFGKHTNEHKGMFFTGYFDPKNPSLTQINVPY